MLSRNSKVVIVLVSVITCVLCVSLVASSFKLKGEKILNTEKVGIESVNSKLGVYYEEEITDFGFITRAYHINSATIVAESFGYEINDYYKVDEYGLPEFFCNCVYGGDGHRELYVYKLQDDMVMQGTVDYEKLNLPDFDYWGANALQTEYDSDSDSIKVYYSTDFHEDLKVTYVGFDVLHFILWDPTPAASIYTGGDKT